MKVEQRSEEVNLTWIGVLLKDNPCLGERAHHQLLTMIQPFSCPCLIFSQKLQRRARASWENPSTLNILMVNCSQLPRILLQLQKHRDRKPLILSHLPQWNLKLTDGEQMQQPFKLHTSTKQTKSNRMGQARFEKASKKYKNQTAIQQ
eukprot:scaffold3914_cov121-Cylindrotheca_fusiformis.AAC.9